MTLVSKIYRLENQSLWRKTRFFYLITNVKIQNFRQEAVRVLHLGFDTELGLRIKLRLVGVRL